MSHHSLVYMLLSSVIIFWCLMSVFPVSTTCLVYCGQTDWTYRRLSCPAAFSYRSWYFIDWRALCLHLLKLKFWIEEMGWVIVNVFSNANLSGKDMEKAVQIFLKHFFEFRKNLAHLSCREISLYINCSVENLLLLYVFLSKN